MKKISNIVYVGFAALLLCSGCMFTNDRAYWKRKGDTILPWRAFRQEATTREFLARVERADASLTEEDLMEALLLLMHKSSYWLTNDRSHRRLAKRLMTSLMAHPSWTHRYDGFLTYYASTLPGEGESSGCAAAREVFGFPAKRTKAKDVDYPLDGTWLDWLKPAAEKWDDRLTWRKLSFMEIKGVGWFKEPPSYPLPVKGRIHCLLRSEVQDWSSGFLKFHPRYGIIFKFDTPEDLKAAVLTFNGGLDERLYSAVPNIFYLPGAQIPHCSIMTYSDDESACYLLSVSSFWTWSNTTWKSLPDEVVPPSKQKGTR